MRQLDRHDRAKRVADNDLRLAAIRCHEGGDVLQRVAERVGSLEQARRCARFQEAAPDRYDQPNAGSVKVFRDPNNVIGNMISELSRAGVPSGSAFQKPEEPPARKPLHGEAEVVGEEARNEGFGDLRVGAFRIAQR